MHLSLNERISRQKKNEIKQLNIARIKRNIKYGIIRSRGKNHFSSKQRESLSDRVLSHPFKEISIPSR